MSLSESVRGIGVEPIHVVAKTHELQLVNTFQPYIVRNLDYFAILDMNLKRALSNDVRASVPHAFDEDRIRRVLATAEFRNVIAIKYDITTDLVDVLAGTIRQARGVEALLTRELNARGS